MPLFSRGWSAALLSCLLTATLLRLPSLAQEKERLPEISREYRGVWVATVANIDWPSKPALSTDTQKEEAIAILDKIASMNMNLVVLQVRTSCDALYESPLEPWSYYLTGEQGKAPSPYYDPLQFWVEESHKRGLELHAWFNPFRAKQSGQRYPDADSHISKTHPELVKKYGNDKTNYLWLDPGEATAREHSLKVFMDVVQRYDIDGVHIDDYFYPYPVDDIPFPDDNAWQTYTDNGGKSKRDDWRRESMNAFIRDLYAEIKKTKPHVKFGISPFGIWKPGYPSSVSGMSQYDKLYADAKLWLNEGWCDYYTPQLYWSISAPKQSFPALLTWWAVENTKNRHLAPGIYTSRVGQSKGYSAEQVESQVFLSRYMPGSSGSIHFSMKALLQNREKLADSLTQNAYTEPALLPESRWIPSEQIAAPELAIKSGENASIEWNSKNSQAVRQWVVYQKFGGKWSYRVLGNQDHSLILEKGKMPSRVAVIAIDGSGKESDPVFLDIPQ